MKFDYYEKLEISQDATDEQIKEAYRTLAQMFHPDNHNRSSDKIKQMANKKFKDINEAYETLSDGSLRMEYDAKRQEEQYEDSGDFEDEFDEEDEDGDEYEDEYEYARHEREYSNYVYRSYERDGNNEQLNDAIYEARKSAPKVVKVLAVFLGALGWIMFVSFGLGNLDGEHVMENTINFYRQEIDNLHWDINRRLEELASLNWEINELNNMLQQQANDADYYWRLINSLNQLLETLEWENMQLRWSLEENSQELERLRCLLYQHGIEIAE